MTYTCVGDGDLTMHGHPLIVGGSQTYSKGPAALPANAPRYATWGYGPCIFAETTDPDRVQRYIDCMAALGAVILGYRHDVVDEAVRDQLADGVSFSLPTWLEGLLAERLVTLMPKGDWQCRFGKNGTEVVSRAVRLARAHTGRDRVLMYPNGYHGSEDWSMTRPPRNGGVPDAVRGLTSFVERHDLTGIAAAFEALGPACLVFEAVVSTDPVLPPANYFRELRALADRFGVLLVLDEMVTGFRCDIPGAVRKWDIRPDLVCFGKAMANGWPVSALVGRREIMHRIETDVFMSSTFGGEAASLAAAVATIDVIRREGVPERLAELGTALTVAYRNEAKRLGLDTDVYGYPQRLVTRWADPEQRRLFLEALIDRGVLCAGYFNLTLAMCDRAVSDALLDAVRDALQAVAAAAVERRAA